MYFNDHLLTVVCVLHRECAVKFNDYFEFPRQLDMVPYTVQGLAKLEGLYQCRQLTILTLIFFVLVLWLNVRAIV